MKWKTYIPINSDNSESTETCSPNKEEVTNTKNTNINIEEYEYDYIDDSRR